MTRDYVLGTQRHEDGKLTWYPESMDGERNPQPSDNAPEGSHLMFFGRYGEPANHFR